MENFLTDKPLDERSTQDAREFERDPRAQRESYARQQKAEGLAVNVSAGYSGQLSGKGRSDDLQYLQENKHRRRIGSKGLKEFRESIRVGVDALEIIEIFSDRAKSAKGRGNKRPETNNQKKQLVKQRLTE